jgi:hypothetical protein
MREPESDPEPGDEPENGGPWAKTSSGDADSITDDDHDDEDED